jgi:hypothetical protein
VDRSRLLTLLSVASFRFRGRLATASATARQRFIDTFDHYLDATVSEAENREQGTVLGLNDYLELRRGNSGVYPAYAVIECILSVDLQPEVFNHPALWNLTKIAGDMLFTANVGCESLRSSGELTNLLFTGYLQLQQRTSWWSRGQQPHHRHRK